MNQDKIKIISDLVKIDEFRSHAEKPDRAFFQGLYSDQSIDNLKKIHDIYTRYLLDYKTLREPYPTVIEHLEFTNEKISSCVSEHKSQVN